MADGGIVYIDSDYGLTQGLEEKKDHESPLPADDSY